VQLAVLSSRRFAFLWTSPYLVLVAEEIKVKPVRSRGIGRE
jgi:hypothetical protein